MDIKTKKIFNPFYWFIGLVHSLNDTSIPHRLSNFEIRFISKCFIIIEEEQKGKRREKSLVSFFNGISNFLGYLIPNPSL